MKIPKLDYPIYNITLPICKKQISFRPFLVKEQKILLLAIENPNKDFLLTNTKQILQNCCLSDIDVNNLATIDIEYFFIHLRAKSVGEVIEKQYKCNNVLNETPCNNTMTLSYDITNFNVDVSNYNDLIELTDTIGVKMKYPTFESLDLLEQSTQKEDIIFDLIISCIDYIYDEDSIYYTKESTKEDLNEFVESLNVMQLRKIKEYFNNLPEIKKEMSLICSRCGFNHSIVIRGMGDFLD